MTKSPYTRTACGLVVFACLAFACENLAAAPLSGTSPAQLSQVERLLADADSAEKTGNLNLGR